MAAVGLTSKEGLTPDHFIELFDALDSELGVLDEPFDLLVVGGAAISLQWNPGRLTSDVDVVSEGLPPELWEAVARVAADREGVEANWLNDAAKIGTLSDQVGADPTPVYAGRNFTIHGASARYVIAMKVVAGRPIDLADMPSLLAAADFESIDELLDWVARAHSHHQIPVASRYIIEEAWGAHLQTRDRNSGGLLPDQPRKRPVKEL